MAESHVSELEAGPAGQDEEFFAAEALACHIPHPQVMVVSVMILAIKAEIIRFIFMITPFCRLNFIKNVLN